MNNIEAHNHLATAILELRDAGNRGFSSDGSATDRIAVKTASGTVIIGEDGTVIFTPDREIMKSLQESYKSIDKGHFIMSGASGNPCPACGGSGKV